MVCALITNSSRDVKVQGVVGHTISYSHVLKHIRENVLSEK